VKSILRSAYKPRIRLATMFRWISFDPDKIDN